MSVQRIAERYAKSLIDLAKDSNRLDVVYNDAQTLKSAMANRDLYLMLKSPIINTGKKTSIVKEIFAGKVDAVTMAFLQIILNKGREAYLPEIAQSLIEQYNVLNGKSTVKITTAVEMDSNWLDSMKKKIIESGVTTSNVELQTKVDPSLLGGFVIEVGDKILNASVAYKLEQLKKELVTA